MNIFKQIKEKLSFRPGRNGKVKESTRYSPIAEMAKMQTGEVISSLSNHLTPEIEKLVSPKIETPIETKADISPKIIDCGDGVKMTVAGLADLQRMHDEIDAKRALERMQKTKANDASTAKTPVIEKSVAPAPVYSTAVNPQQTFNSTALSNSRQSIVDQFLTYNRQAEAAANAQDKKVFEAMQREKAKAIEHRKKRFTRILEKALSDVPDTQPNFNHDMQDDAKRKLAAAIEQESQGYPDGPSSNPYDVKDSIDEVKKERVDRLLLGNTPRVSEAPVYNIQGGYFIAYDTGRCFISLDGQSFQGLIKNFGNYKSTPGSTLAANRVFYTDANGQKHPAGLSLSEYLDKYRQTSTDENNFPNVPVDVPDLTYADFADLLKNAPAYNLVMQGYRLFENKSVQFNTGKNGSMVW